MYREIKMEKSIVTFGEILLRLSAPGTKRFPQSKEFKASFGGSEANVAVSLASLGRRVEYITRIPDNDLGKACMMVLRQFNIGMDYTVHGGKRLGSYYMETAAAMRSSKVVYDREGSAFATLTADMVDWDAAFADAGWFHWSGIAAALSESTAEACWYAIGKAKKAGLTVCCDINYRKNLWNYGKTFEEVMRPLVGQGDVVFGSEDEWEHILGLEAGSFSGIVEKDDGYAIDRENCEMMVRLIKEAYPEIGIFTVEMRRVVNANHHLLSAVIYDGKETVIARLYDIDDVVDCVGVGDAYISALVNGLIIYPGDLRSAVEFGLAASTLKNTIPGDFNLVSEDEVLSLMNGNTSGRVQR